MIMNVYVGWDSREVEAFNACRDSILANTKSQNVNVVPLKINDLINFSLYNRTQYFPEEVASTEFAFTRFLVPYLNMYRGHAVFMDCDMIVTEDIEKLFRFANPHNAVAVVKHDYVPKFSVKMDGQAQVKYPRKNWSSVMLFNCSHNSCQRLNPKSVSRESGAYLHRFEWCDDKEIGSLPLTWNWLEGEYEKPEKTPSNIHYTNGGPWFPNICNSRHIEYWQEYMKYASKYMSAKEIKDVHNAQDSFEKQLQ